MTSPADGTLAADIVQAGMVWAVLVAILCVALFLVVFPWQYRSGYDELPAQVLEDDGPAGRELLEAYSRDHARIALARQDLSKIVRFEPRALHSRPLSTVHSRPVEDSNHVA